MRHEGKRRSRPKARRRKKRQPEPPRPPWGAHEAEDWHHFRICRALLEEVSYGLRRPAARAGDMRLNRSGSMLALHRRIAADQAWALSNHEGPFSFVVVCEVLKLDPEAVRQEWRSQGLFRASATLVEHERAAVAAGSPRMKRSIAA